MSLSKMELLRLTYLTGLWRSAEKQRPVKRFHICTAIRKSWFIGKKKKSCRKSAEGQAGATVPQAPLSSSAVTLGLAARAPELIKAALRGQRAKGRNHMSAAGNLPAGRWVTRQQPTAESQLQRPSGQPEARAPPGGAVGQRLGRPTRELAFPQVSFHSPHQPIFSPR